MLFLFTGRHSQVVLMTFISDIVSSNVHAASVSAIKEMAALSARRKEQYPWPGACRLSALRNTFVMV